MKCTCQGVPNPECNYDHAAENERIEALRCELASLPKFVAEAFQFIDSDVVARYFIDYEQDPRGIYRRAEFGYVMAMRIAAAVKEYADHCISNWGETRLCDTSDAQAILRTLIARYR